MGIIRKLDCAVNFKMGKFKIGQIEWGVATYKNKNRWVLHPVPDAWDFATLSEYFHKMSDTTTDVLMARGDSKCAFRAYGF